MFSNLIQLAQDGLGGNAKTLMFVNVSPSEYNADETANSLTRPLATSTMAGLTFSFTAFKSSASSCLSLGEWLTCWPIVTPLPWCLLTGP